MLEYIRRCKYCQLEMMDTSPLSYAENPFCMSCLEQRLTEGSEKNKNLSWAVNGSYMLLTKDVQK
jgi:hypothetical protein